MTRANRAHLAAFGLLAALSACTSGNLDNGAGGGNAETKGPPAEGVRSSPLRDPNALTRALRPTPLRPLDNPGLAPLQLDPTLPSDDALVAPGEQRNARIAGSEKVFLAVWEDDRDGVTSLYGARLYPDGSVLDKGGLRIASGPVSSPHVAFDGATFHVAWSTGVEVRTTTVEPELGTVGDAKVLTTGSDVTVVGLAAGPDAIGVMTRTAQEIVSEAEYGLIRRTSKGTTFNSFGTATGVPGMAYCGDRFFLALPRSAAPKVQLFELLAAETVPSDTKLKFQAQFPHNVTLACRKKDVLVAWEESSLANAPVDAIVAQRPFAPTPNTTVLTKAGGAPSAPSATVVGNGFAIGWQDAKASFSEIAYVGDASAPPYELFPFMRAPSLATNRPANTKDEVALVVFHDWWTPNHPAPATASEVRVAPLGASVLEPYLVSSQPNPQGEVALASTGVEELALWTDFRYRGDLGDPTRIALGAGALPTTNAEPFPLTDDNRGTSREPAIAGADGVWLAGWSTKSVKGTTVLLTTGSGVGVGGTALLPSTETLIARNPSIAAAADSFLIAFEEGVEVCTTSCAYVPSTLGVGRVKADGKDITLLGFSELPGALPRDPFVARTKENDALIVWERDGDLYAASTTGGDLLLKLPAAPMLTLTGRQSRPRLAFREDAAEGLLLWEDDSSNGKRIMACLIDAAGKPLSVPVVVSGTLASSHPTALVYRGKYLVAWEGSEAGGVPQIYSAAVQFDGVTVDPKPQRISSLALDTEVNAAPALDTLAASYAPALVASSTGALVLAYEQQIRRVGTRRVVAVELPPEASLGELCGAGSECASRYCVDGVCCESSCEGSCMECSGAVGPDGPATAGKCLPVTVGGDDSCQGAFRCASDGLCKQADGSQCTTNADCASGFCANAPSPDDPNRLGICCDRACDGGCDSCSEPVHPGQCVTANCGAFRCVVSNAVNGSKQCLDQCEDSSQCTAGHQCVAGDCLAATNAEVTNVGCSCSTSGHDEGLPTRWLGLAGLGAALTRRARRRPRATVTR